MATTPPGQPWIEGGGPSAPYVLRWAAAGGPNRVVGYVVEKRVIGGGDGSFKQLTGNTGSKAPRFGLLSSHVEPASAYSFRVAALISAAAGHQQRGDFSEASEPLEALLPVGMLSNPSLGVGARLDPSMGGEGPSLAASATATVAAVKGEMEAWERQFEKKHGARPSVSDKVSSREYQQLAKRHKQLRRGSSPRETTGPGAGDVAGDGAAGGSGHRGHSRHGGGGGREERSRRGGKENKELAGLREEERTLGKSLYRWEAEPRERRAAHRVCHRVCLLRLQATTTRTQVVGLPRLHSHAPRQVGGRL